MAVAHEMLMIGEVRAVPSGEAIINVTDDDNSNGNGSTLFAGTNAVFECLDGANSN